MKSTLIRILALCVALAGVTTAQDLIQKTEGQKIAEQIDASQVELFRHFEASLVNLYNRVNTPGKQQETLDALGTRAAEALVRYAKARAFVIEIDPSAASRIPAPNPEVFVANPDGTVTYVAPPAPPLPGE